jgi:molybdopterin/thiamine biosynthesis adenylyltransferase
LLKPWWERQPERLADELRRLDEACIPYRVDPGEREQGRIKLDVEVRIDERTHRFQVFFPAMYPYTRFEVLAPDLDMPRHQNPFQKNLCLIGRATANWNVDDTLADFLLRRVPLTIAVGSSSDTEFQRREEEPQGEPFSDHYVYGAGSSLLIDSAWQIDPTIRKGKLKLAVESNAHPIRGVVLEVLGPADVVLARAPAALADRYPHTVWGRWVRRGEPIREIDPNAFLNVMAQDDGSLRQKRTSIRRPVPPDIIGVVFPEEVQQGVAADGWVFVGRAQNGIALVRAARAGPDDVQVRAPELSAMRHKRVAVAGLGSLGAPSAVELARCGVGKLVLADHDFVEAGTISRWPLGLTAVGKLKVDALRDFIRANYPYTAVATSAEAIGGALNPPNADLRTLDDLLSSDLILDATAEVGIQHLLSELARERGTPYVCVSATAGAWGGLITRIRPHATQGCWVCLQHAINKMVIPVPVEKPNGFVQPPGCASPTFTGAGFDTGLIAQLAVQMAAMTLCDDSTDWDVAVINLRNAAGDRIPLQMRTFPLDRQPECRSALHDASVAA